MNMKFLKLSKICAVAAALMLVSTPFVSCSDDDDPDPNKGQQEEPKPDDPEPEQPEVPIEKFAPEAYEPIINFGEEVAWFKKNETREFYRDTTVNLLGLKTVRTLMYWGGDNDIAYFYYYHFEKAEMNQAEMLAPYDNETNAIIKIMLDRYQYWRFDNSAKCDTYLSPDSLIRLRHEIWEDQTSGAQYNRFIYDPITPDEIHRFWE